MMMASPQLVETSINVTNNNSFWNYTHLDNHARCQTNGTPDFKAFTQPCQNVPAAGKFATFSPFLAAYSTLDFTMSPLAGKGTWCLLPTTPSMLPTATKHFDRAVY